jgi:nucleotide-binding universal stress UspA family protein
MNSDDASPIIWFVDSRSTLLSHFDGETESLHRLSRTEWLRSRDPRHATIRDGITVGISQGSNASEDFGEDRDEVIIVPLSFSAASFQVADVAHNIARHTNARLVLCHAIFPRMVPTRFSPEDTLREVEALCHEALEKMQPAAALAKEFGVAATCVAEPGTPMGLTLKLAKLNNASLIILTCGERNAWSRLFFGRSITEQIISQAECHVMVVRRAGSQKSGRTASDP